MEKLLEKKHGLSFKLVQLSSKWEALAKGKKVFINTCVMTGFLSEYTEYFSGVK